MRMIDLFSGIGGFHYAAEQVWGDDLDVICHVETDPFCQKVLRKHWPDVPIHEDIKDFNYERAASETIGAARINLLTGGFP